MVRILVGVLAIALASNAYADGRKCILEVDPENEVEFSDALKQICKVECSAVCEKAELACGDAEAECYGAAATCWTAEVSCDQACGSAANYCELNFPPFEDICPDPEIEDLIAKRKAKCEAEKGKFRAMVKPNKLWMRCKHQSD